MHDTDSVSPRDPDSADDPVSRLLPESSVLSPKYRADEKHGFTRTWLATSSSVRPNRDPTRIEWGIHWYTPVSIFLLLLAGTATAIAHHLFYRYLDNSLVGGEVKQRWSLWIGSGLSFLTKVMLTAALGIARTQWVWMTLRSEWFTLDGIDALFGIVSDPALFLNWRMIKKAKVATIMAIGMWMFPLAAILTPGTISVHTVPLTHTVACSVPSLLFGFDRNSTATIPAWSELARNVTVVGFLTLENMMILTSITPLVRRSMSLPAYSGIIANLRELPRADLPSPTTVGALCGANCTYTVEFLGPTIICKEFTDWSNSRWDNSIEFMAGSFYMGDSTSLSSDYGTILVGIELPDRKRYPSVYVGCQSGSAHYTVKHVIEERNFLQPSISKVEIAPPIVFPFHTSAESVQYYPHTALLTLLYEIVNGEMTTGSMPNSPSANSVLSDVIYTDPSKIGAAIETMAHTMVVSLIAAGVPMEGDGNVLDVAAIQETNCTISENITLYVYSSGTLLIVYGLAVSSALVTSVAGFIALRHNGMASNRSVSTFIRTTRNRTLDDCIVGADCLGGDVMSSELAKVKLQFGALKARGTAPFALGVKGEIGPIKRD
ncbi:hypothetical protein Q9L58_005891 [Maublancomyces gigas]|uniref:Transmembrane protein n=1 Tax=Discina gigas TaxID=1032678 RepID=A0ABR3GGU7_9PEZI